MTDQPDRSHGPHIDRELAALERALGDRLQVDRPVPAAGFRGALGRHLAARDPGYRPRPARLRLIAFAYLAAGVTLLALGALQAVGAL